MKAAKTDHCELCSRQVELTFHHLIPKKMHNKRPIKKRYEQDYLDHYGVWICNDCHKKIHRTLKHEELAFEYSTLELLMEHPEIKKFVEWVGKQTKRVK